jgi:hypothetical protein
MVVADILGIFPRIGHPVAAGGGAARTDMPEKSRDWTAFVFQRRFDPVGSLLSAGS